MAIPNIPFDVNITEMSNGNLAVGLTSRGLELQEKIPGNVHNHELIISTLELEHSEPCIGFNFDILRRPKFNRDKAIARGIPKELWGKLQSGKVAMHGERRFQPNMVLEGERKGIKLSYTMDTRPIDSIIDFIRGSDLFVSEGTYGSDEDIDKAKKYKHMTFREAAQLAYDGGVEELLLAHFGPAMDNPAIYADNAREVFPNTIMGYDRLIKSLPFKDD